MLANKSGEISFLSVPFGKKNRWWPLDLFGHFYCSALFLFKVGIRRIKKTSLKPIVYDLIKWCDVVLLSPPSPLLSIIAPPPPQPTSADDIIRRTFKNKLCPGSGGGGHFSPESWGLGIWDLLSLHATRPNTREENISVGRGWWEGGRSKVIRSNQHVIKFILRFY